MNAVTRKDLFNSIKKTFIKIVKESLQTGWDLTKIMAPILIVTKILQEFGAVALLGKILNPLMGWVGLPGGMALVWGMAILISPYGGLILYASLASQYPLTVAQATVLAALILMAHAMPLEIRIAQKAGLRVSLQLILRVGGAFLFGWLLHQFYSLTGYLQVPNQAVFNITQQDPTWLGWAWAQVKNLGTTYLIIFSLLSLMEILEKLGALNLLKRLLEPLLHLMGMSKEAAPITIIGITLGLGLGGGLVIQEAKSGRMQKKDIFFSLVLMCLFHSLIEDTIVMLMLGAHLSGILWARLLFSFVVVFSMVKIINLLPQKLYDRYVKTIS